jgi:gluconate 2-dehydrogenase gamma chain
VNNDDLTRRSFLIALGEALGVAAVGLSWTDVVRAAHEAHAASQPGSAPATTLLTATEAADIEAIAAQIIPSDDTPGAREAGVVHFIDRALSSFYARLAGDFRSQLADFQAACRAANPDAPSFSGLSSERQIAFLRMVDQTPFFGRVHLLTLLGMFSTPAYGGNLQGLGWKLIGFEDRHVFQPPFGWYDRDYPGFVIEPEKPT